MFVIIYIYFQVSFESILAQLQKLQVACFCGVVAVVFRALCGAGQIFILSLLASKAPPKAPQPIPFT